MGSHFKINRFILQGTVEGRGVYGGLVGKTEGKIHLEDLGIDGKIILR
jgi:hypothetical protein